jgi:hypothetical protein
VSKSSLCPQCHAQLPRRGRFCLECGYDLYERGVRRPPTHLVPIAVLVLAVVALGTYLVTHDTGERKPPEYYEVVGLTQEFLRLAAKGEYKTIVSRFYEPDAEVYRKTGELLREIARGNGAPGLNLFRAATTNDPNEAENFCRKYNVEHREYVAGLLGALGFDDGVLRPKLGAPYGEERTETFIAWYLFLVFRSVAEPEKAEVADARWETRGESEHLYGVTLRFPEPLGELPPAPIPGVADPTKLEWRRLGEGRWALTLGCLDDHFLLEEVLALLQRVKP